MGKQGYFVVNSVGYREPMKFFEGGSDVVVLTLPCQDPSSAILNILKLLKVFSRDPNKESITVV